LQQLFALTPKQPWTLGGTRIVEGGRDWNVSAASYMMTQK